MDKVIKRKWVKALRSRKYKQGLNQLKSLQLKSLEPGIQSLLETYCCLGVLCEVMKEKYLPNDAKPGNRVLRKAGLSEGDCYCLITLNDGGGGMTNNWKFYQIANWIEKNL